MTTNLKPHPFDDSRWLIAILLLQRFVTEAGKASEATEPRSESDKQALLDLLHETCDAIWKAKMLYLPPEALKGFPVALIHHHAKAQPFQLTYALLDLMPILGQFYEMREIDVTPGGEVIEIDVYRQNRDAAAKAQLPRLLSARLIQDKPGSQEA